MLEKSIEQPRYSQSVINIQIEFINHTILPATTILRVRMIAAMTAITEYTVREN